MKRHRFLVFVSLLAGIDDNNNLHLREWHSGKTEIYKVSIMFNEYIQNFNNSVNIKPACMGMLQKSHPNSFFNRFHKTSEMASWLFDEKPCLKRYKYNDSWETYMEVIVLQVMCFGDNEFLCELIDKKIFTE